MLKRIISGIIGVPLLIIILLKGGFYLYLATMLVTLIGLYEFYHAMMHKKYKPITFIGYVLTIIILTIFYYSFNLIYLLAFIILTIIIISSVQLIKPQHSIIDV